MLKRIAKFVAVYYVTGVVFLLLITSIWRDEGIMTFHLEIIKVSVLEPMFWLQAVIWPMFIACYLPENIICHA